MFTTFVIIIPNEFIVFHLLTLKTLTYHDVDKCAMLIDYYVFRIMMKLNAVGPLFNQYYVSIFSFDMTVYQRTTRKYSYRVTKIPSKSQ